MSVRRLLPLGAAVALVAAALAAPSALATFHEISIREVYAGSTAHPESQYVELQMWAAGQNLVGGRSLTTYGANGGASGTTAFAGNVSGAATQSTILLATLAAESEFGVTPDAVLTPGQLNPSGGAACWAETIDCVSWGSFSGTLSSPVGSPAVAIPDGMALRRMISPGCATLLEPTDDRDNSAIDFSAVFPSPRPNSIAPTERACAFGGGPTGGTGGPGSQGSRRAPQTALTRKPPRKTRDRTPTFRFIADETGVTYQCRLDSKPFRACHSPFTTRKLSQGHHVFQVRARNESGTLDPSAATYAFRVNANRA
jgi:hypothetical protein